MNIIEWINDVKNLNTIKELFGIIIKELEKLVREIDTIVEVNMIMMVDEYRESLSSDVIYTDDAIVEFTDDE